MRIFIFGTGMTEKRARQEYLKYYETLTVLGYLDNDIRKQGMNYEGKEVFSPNILFQLKEEDYDGIVILSIYYDEIYEQLVNIYHVDKNKIGNEYFFEKMQVVERYRNSDDDEIQDIITYLESHQLNVFNYSFVDKYDNLMIDVYVDERNGFPYIFDTAINKRVYFPKTWNQEKVKKYYTSVLLEQDKKSPHYYNDGYKVNVGDIVVDVGVAEGNFSLNVVERAKAIYLIECEQEWIEALKWTFEPFKEKVHIIRACAGEYDNESSARLDTLINEKVDVIKMDIEGGELSALKGVEKISKAETRFIVCTYHKANDAEDIKDYFNKREYDVCFSKGYMWYINGSDLRRGLLFAKKRKV